MKCDEIVSCLDSGAAPRLEQKKNIRQVKSPMNLQIRPSKTSRIRAAAAANPDLSHEELARKLGLLQSDVRQALSADPMPKRLPHA